MNFSSHFQTFFAPLSVTFRATLKTASGRSETPTSLLSIVGTCPLLLHSQRDLIEQSLFAVLPDRATGGELVHRFRGLCLLVRRNEILDEVIIVVDGEDHIQGENEQTREQKA